MSYTNGWFQLDSSAYKVSQMSLPINAEITDDESGTLYAEAVAMTGQRPQGEVTTNAIRGMLATIGVTGMCISPSAINNADFIARRIGNCDDPLGATPHYRVRVTKGLATLGALNASRNADAAMSVLVSMFQDGATAPYAITDGVVEPSNIISERFRLYTSKIAGVQFKEIEDISLAFNISLVEEDPEFGYTAPGKGGVLTIRPELTLRGRDLAKVKTGLIEAVNTASHANTIIQLQRIKDGASFYDPGENQHINLTIAGLAVPSTLINASAGQRSTNEITLTTRYDGTNVPIIVAVDQPLNANP